MRRLVQLLCTVSTAWSYTRPFLTRQDICGIWKVSRANLTFPGFPNIKPTENEEVVLRLNEDGTFDPYTSMPSTNVTLQEDVRGVLGRGGTWEYRDETLLLAPDRPENVDSSKVFDTLLMGKLDVQVSECLSAQDPSLVLPDVDVDTNQQVSGTSPDVDVHLSISQGLVSIGKFMYPKKHKAFFEEPILFQHAHIGTFYMNQLLGNLNARLKQERETPRKPDPKFKKGDFYNRTFYLTTAPHPVNPTFAQLDVHYNENLDMIDIRVVPITFHPNNTFSAYGTEKVLRGRFEITGEEGDSVYFRVSLFGFGRSAPGSVFSEGRLLSQDDRRAYIGTIQSYEKNNRTLLFVEGEFYYGFGNSAKKANSMGTFTMQEVDREGDKNDDDDDDEEEEEVDSSIYNGETTRSWENIDDIDVFQ